MTNTPIWDELIEQVRDQPVYGHLRLLFGELDDGGTDLPAVGELDGPSLDVGEPTGE